MGISASALYAANLCALTWGSARPLMHSMEGRRPPKRKRKGGRWDGGKRTTFAESSRSVSRIGGETKHPKPARGVVPPFLLIPPFPASQAGHPWVLHLLHRGGHSQSGHSRTLAQTNYQQNKISYKLISKRAPWPQPPRLRPPMRGTESRASDETGTAETDGRSSRSPWGPGRVRGARRGRTEVTLWSIRKLRTHKLRIVDPRFPGKSPMDLGIQPLKVKNMMESNPLKSRFLVCGLAIASSHLGRAGASNHARSLVH